MISGCRMLEAKGGNHEVLEEARHFFGCRHHRAHSSLDLSGYQIHRFAGRLLADLTLVGVGVYFFGGIQFFLGAGLGIYLFFLWFGDPRSVR